MTILGLKKDNKIAPTILKIIGFLKTKKLQRRRAKKRLASNKNCTRVLFDFAKK